MSLFQLLNPFSHLAKANRVMAVMFTTCLLVALIASVLISGPPGYSPVRSDSGFGQDSSSTTTSLPEIPDDQLVVSFLDVGQGDSILFQGPDFTVLIDTGRHDRSDVVPYLHDLGVSDIDLLVGTHPHADHIGQMDQVLQAFPVTEVWLNGEDHTTQTYERVLDAILDSDAGYHEPRAGETLELAALGIAVLHPDRLTGSMNDNSIVMSLTFGEVTFLLTGDAEAQAERQMIASGQHLDAQILKVGHHGSSTSSTAEFLAEASPEMAVYSASADNQYGHPHQDTLTRLSDLGVDVYGTDLHGTVTVTTDGGTYEVGTARPDVPALSGNWPGISTDVREDRSVLHRRLLTNQRSIAHQHSPNQFI